MNGWCTAGPEHQSFTYRLGCGSHPIPLDHTKSAQTKRAGATELARIRNSLHTLRRMDINKLQISDAHMFTWAINLLDQYGPELDTGNTTMWSPLSSMFPDHILGENDVMACGKTSLLQPTIAAGIFIYANHYGLSSTEAGCYPKGKWSLQDRSIIGSDRQTDLVVARVDSKLSRERDPVALVCEAKMYHVCHSKGIAIDGVGRHKMPVLPELQPWFERDGNVPLLPAANGEDETDFDAYYPQPWQRKIQILITEKNKDCEFHSKCSEFQNLDIFQ